MGQGKTEQKNSRKVGGGDTPTAELKDKIKEDFHKAISVMRNVGQERTHGVDCMHETHGVDFYLH